MFANNTVFKSIELDKASKSDDLLSFVASDESPDRHGDIVRAAGWDLKQYRRNPIVLFGHDHSLPVGVTRKLGLEKSQLLAGIKLANEGTSEFIDTLRRLVDQQIVRAVSVGFRVTAEPTYIRDPKNDRVVGLEFNGTELLEISLVTVPANANALSAKVKAYGVSERTFNRLQVAPNALVQAAERERVLLLRKLGASGTRKVVLY
jgi:HK97 family phage prohead protease